MVASQSTITLQDIQNAIKGLGAVLVEVANTLRQIAEAIGQATRLRLEEVARRNQDHARNAVLLFVEQSQRNNAETLARENVELRKVNVELRKQIWKQRPM